MSQDSSNSGNGTDDLLVWLVGIPVALVVLPGVVGKFIPAAQEALVRWQILTTNDVLISVGGAAGLDLGRCLIAAALIAFSIAALVFTVRHRSTARQR